MIFIQDLKSRAVYWILFPLLFACLFILKLIEHNTVNQIFESAGINLVFLGVQMLAVSAYFSIKNKRWVKITTALLGWGDVLLLLCLTVCFSVLNYLLFYVMSLLLSLMTWMILKAVNLVKSQHIPLAGFQSIVLVLLFISAWWVWPLNLNSDAWLLQYFN